MGHERQDGTGGGDRGLAAVSGAQRLCGVWAAQASRLHVVEEGGDVGVTGAPEGFDPARRESGLRALPPPLSSGRGGAAGAALLRVWVGCVGVHWLPTLPRERQRPVDPCDAGEASGPNQPA